LEEGSKSIVEASGLATVIASDSLKKQEEEEKTN